MVVNNRCRDDYLGQRAIGEEVLERAIIKIEPLGTIDVHDRSEDGIPISSISGAKLLKNVEMSYDKGKNLLDESEKLTEGQL